MDGCCTKSSASSNAVQRSDLALWTWMRKQLPSAHAGVRGAEAWESGVSYRSGNSLCNMTSRVKMTKECGKCEKNTSTLLMRLANPIGVGSCRTKRLMAAVDQRTTQNGARTLGING